MSAQELMQMLEDSVEATQKEIQFQMMELSPNSCNLYNPCIYNKKFNNYTESGEPDKWGDMQVNYSAIRTYWPQNALTYGTTYNKFSCTSEKLSSNYIRYYKEFETDRVAWQYTGFQDQGYFSEWPYIDFCNYEFDPRFRPWYALSASGPKDIVLVIDISGSMSGSRILMAKEAALAVMDTLTYYDYASLILFNGSAKEYPSDGMMKMTPDNKESMKNYINDNVYAGGGTNFSEAFKAVNNSINNSGTSSGCGGLILFMTDGVSSLDMKIISDLDSNYRVLTYLFGSGASLTVGKQVSCATKGIYFQVPNGSDLKSVMAKYYYYFVSLSEKAYTERRELNSNTRWIEYSDFNTEEGLLAACRPLYDLHNYIGVTCKDINMMVSLTWFKWKWDYYYVKYKYETKSMKCVNLDLSDSSLETARFNASGISNQCG